MVKNCETCCHKTCEDKGIHNAYPCWQILDIITLKNALVDAGFFMLKDNTYKKGGVVWIEPELVDNMTPEQFNNAVELLLEKINERM